MQNYLKGHVCENVEIQIISGGTTENLRDHEKAYIKYFKFQLADDPVYLNLPYGLNVLFSNSTY